MNMCEYIYIYIHIHTYIHTYIYLYYATDNSSTSGTASCALPASWRSSRLRRCSTEALLLYYYYYYHYYYYSYIWIILFIAIISISILPISLSLYIYIYTHRYVLRCSTEAPSRWSPAAWWTTSGSSAGTRTWRTPASCTGATSCWPSGRYYFY